MRDLIKYEGGNLHVSPYALSVPEFKALGIKELSFLFFMHDPRSPYMRDSEDERRSRLYTEYNVKDSKALRAAEHVYIDLCDTPQVKALKSAYKGIEQLQRYFNTLDILEVDDKGKRLHHARDITQAISQLNGSMKGLEALEEAVRAQALEAVRIKGGVEKTRYNED